MVERPTSGEALLHSLLKNREDLVENVKVEGNLGNSGWGWDRRGTAESSYHYCTFPGYMKKDILLKNLFGTVTDLPSRVSQGKNILLPKRDFIFWRFYFII